MLLYLLRHGQAEPNLLDDEVRRLTELGRGQTQAVMQRRAADMQQPTAIWASPLVRAQQTAHIAQPFFATVPLQTYTELVPEGSTAAIYDLLASFHGRALLVVGHQPLLGNLLNELCGNAPGALPMGTSSLACVQLTLPAAGFGELVWLQHADGL